MNSTRDLLLQIAEPELLPGERVQLRCRLARQLEGAGNYEAAREAMGELWTGVGEGPIVHGLDQEIAAEVFLRIGALTGWIGYSRKILGSQETAKGLINQSISIFQSSRNKVKLVEAQIDLACCYWREGAFDEARVMLRDALSDLGALDNALKAVAMRRAAIVEDSANRPNDALRIYCEAAPLFEESSDQVLKGQFHQGFGFVLKKLGAAEQRRDYIDRAFIEFTAASSCFERAGLSRDQGCVEKNLGLLLGTIGKFVEAHEHLDRAQALFTTLRDSIHLAQVDGTRAQVLLAAGRVAEAEKLVKVAVRSFEKGGDQSLLAEALTTHGLVLALLTDHSQARATLERALDVADHSGDLESTGQAALTLIEQLGHHLSNEQVCGVLKRASALVETTQDMNTLRRLTVGAFRGLFLIQASAEPPDWAAFYFRHAVRRYEAGLIKMALQEAGGSVTRAAHLLGFGHHQSLASLLNNRHKNLLYARRPVVPRKRSLTSKHEPARRSGSGDQGKPSDDPKPAC